MAIPLSRRLASEWWVGDDDDCKCNDTFFPILLSLLRRYRADICSFQSQPDKIPRIDETFKPATCDAWDAYTSANLVDQIDAGS